jgi:hypothetical protein
LTATIPSFVIARSLIVESLLIDDLRSLIE